MAFMVLAVRLQPRGDVRRRGRVKTDLAAEGGKAAAEEAATIGQSIMGPGGFMKDPISAISFGMALMFGTAGLPHILMRFFTVPDAKEARKSVMWATGWIGYFYILTFIIGFGAITFVLTNPGVPDDEGRADRRRQHGGDPPRQRGRRQRLPGFISAVAFATILAVVAGLTLSAPRRCRTTCTPRCSRAARPTAPPS